jgi:rhamnogalacturonan hydrolase
MWSQNDRAVYKCMSAYGTGVDCIKPGTGDGYDAVIVTATRPAGYTTPTTMAGDLVSGFDARSTIPVP